MSFVGLNDLTYIEDVYDYGDYLLKTYKDKDDKEWTIKEAYDDENFKKLKNESNAFAIYKVLGIPIPEVWLDEKNKALLCKHVEGKQLLVLSFDNSSKEYKDAEKKITKYFIIDALLANKSMSTDNALYDVIIPDDGGKPVRTSMEGVYEFEEPIDEVTEIYNTFGSGITAAEIKTQVQDILIPNKSIILGLIDSSIKPIIEKRIQYLVDNYNSDTTAKSAIKSSAKTTAKSSSSDKSAAKSIAKTTAKSSSAKSAVKSAEKLKTKDDIPALDELTFLNALGGSTGALLYQDGFGKKWVVKRASSGGGFKQVIAEATANMIYHSLGVPVPNFKLDTLSKSLILEYIDGKLLANTHSDELKEAKEKLSKHFVVDALLANWDVIGLAKDNVIVATDGTPYRIDNGGTFTFRAQGKPKDFNGTVVELDTMRNKKLSPQAADVFRKLTDDDINKQIKEIIEPNAATIVATVDDKLKGVMQERIDNLIDIATSINIPVEKPGPTEKPEYVDKINTALMDFFKSSVGSATTARTLKLYINKVNKLLVDTKAIISGGFILKAIGAFEQTGDLDIYVSTNKIAEFKSELRKLFKPDLEEINVASEADTIFLEKNHILSVTHFSKTISGTSTNLEIDIVEIDADKTPVDVITNADLSFCENWYDGKKVFMMYPEHVEKKEGFVENNYLGLYKQDNSHLLKRMKKYIERGFKISIYNTKTKAMEDVTEVVKNKKLDGTKEERRVITNNIGSLELIDDDTTKALDKTSISANIDAVAPSTSVVPEINTSILSKLEIELLKFYTNNGYSYINSFLHTTIAQYLPGGSKVVSYLKKKLPKDAANTAEMYEYKILFHIVVNMYNAIQRSPKVSPQVPFKVKRGSHTAYLKEDTTKFYYMNSFVSTSTNLTTSGVFGQIQYVFLVHPLCRYANVKKISHHKREDEVLFTPYHRYIFISKAGKESKFIVLPTDLDIPKTFDEFFPWKSTVATRSSGGRLKLSSGKLRLTYKKSSARRSSVKRNTLKKLKQVTPKKASSSTRKMSQKKESQKKVSSSSTRKASSTEKAFVERLTEPIPSFPGKEPTKKEKEMIDAMMKFFDK